MGHPLFWLSKCFLLLSSLIFLNENVWAQSSVLSDGLWYKIGVTQQGVYKINYEFLKAIGIAPESVDPRKIRIFGHGGGMLPQPNQAFRYAGLQENAIFVQGEADGVFNTHDYLLFYGQSPDRFTYTLTDSLVFQKNLYTDTVYYFLNIEQAAGKRVPQRETISGNFPVINTFNAYAAHEADIYKVIASGREWFGEKFASGQIEDFTFTFPGIKENSDIKLDIEVMHTSLSAASFDVFLNGQSVGEIQLEAVLEGTYTEKGKIATASFQVDGNPLNGQPDARVSLRYNAAGGTQAIGYLNRIEIQAERKLVSAEPRFTFRSLGSVGNGISTFEIDQFEPKSTIWDITNPLLPQEQTWVQDGSKVRFSTTTDTLREFIVFQDQDFLLPVFTGQVANQDLRGKAVPDLLVVVPPLLLNEATQLANFRRQHDGLDVLIVTIAQIYNEFSSGAQDITAIRDYVKYLYDRNPDKLKYLLLFGKCSYDYKDRLTDNTNLVPTYESRNSLHPIYSYSSDDYFGFLEDEEGEWKESSGGDHTLDIGVGRLPVKNKDEAAALVNKLIKYASETKTLGNWRNNIVFVADDGDNDRHQKDAELIANYVDTAFRYFNIRKIYLDAYRQQPIANGEVAPQVNQAIREAVNQGALIVNYTGHGGELGWAYESVLDLDMINKFDNTNQLPFFVTATCEFGRHDDPLRVSGAEQLILNKKGGAIGLVTTARPVFSSSNFKLNSAFYQKVFEKDNGNYATLGAIFRDTKNNGLDGPVNRNFSLLADPSMTLAYPENQIVIDRVENIGQNLSTDTLEALSKIRLTGSIITPETGKKATAFNGILEMIVLDKQAVTKTLGNEGTTMQFNEWNSVIHRGRASVTGGSFTIEFVMPKNIVYKKDFGKISLYAWRTAGSDQLIDANGASTSLVIGGTSNNNIADTTPPAIQLYMDDTSFKNGNITGNNTMLVATLQDENGINISSNGLGQSITARLINSEHQEEQSFMLNDYFTTDLDTYQQGMVQFPINDLAPGKYTIKMKAWDTYNNPGEASIDFVVVAESELAINNLINYPNPFTEQTTFRLDHNQAGDDVSVKIDIYNGQGAIIHTLYYDFPDSNTHLDDMVWDGTNRFGFRLNPGLYIAQVTVQSETTGLKNKKYQKLLKIN